MNIHLKTSFDYIKRSPFQATAAIFVLTLTFFVGTLFAILIYSSSMVLNYFETRPQIIAFLKDSVDDQAISALQNKLSSDKRIEKVRFVTKDEALGIYKQATSDNPLLGELVSPKIFPASLEFTVSDLSYAKTLIEEVKKDPIVDSIGFTASLGAEKNLDDVVSRLRSVAFYIRLGGGVIAGVLAGASFLVLLIIISMRMTGKRDEVEILNLIGATPGFIRSPIILEAIIYALSGVLIGWTLALIFILYSSPSAISYFGEIPILPREATQLLILFALILGVEIVLGLALATTGSMLAINRARRNR